MPNGLSETRTYDRAGRLAQLANANATTTLSQFAYTRDPMGNPTKVVATTGTQSYGYDAAQRLTSVCHSEACSAASPELSTYAYDAVGNRSTEVVGGDSTTYAYDTADRLSSTQGPAGTTSYAYDANGNQTTAGADIFSYDMAGRMTSATVGTSTWSYAYDGDGKRTSASSGPNAADTTRSIWDPNFALPEVALERDGAGATLRRYTYGADRLSMTAGGATSYYLHDGLGSVAGVASSAGALQWSYDYEPFGQARTVIQNDPGAPANPMRFTGELLDQGTGLYHLRARQYDPDLGRFTATDPLAPELDDPYVSAYVYANNRPTVLVDPSGMRGQDPSCPGPGEERVSVTPTTRGSYLGEAPTACVVRVPNGSPWRFIAEAIGFIPVAGDFVDGGLCAFDLTYGELGDAKYSCLAIVPVVGGIATGGKWAKTFNNLAPGGAADAISGRNLGRQLASEQQVGEVGRRIAGPGTSITIRDAQRLASQYGGSPNDWAKMSSSSYRGSDGLQFETHWYQNIRTGQRVEFKTNFPNNSNGGYR